MVVNSSKPRLTRFDDVRLVVTELKRLGVSGKQLYSRVTEIGPVDLDILHEVLRQDNKAA